MNYETTPQPDHAAYVQAQLERDGEDKDWEVVIAEGQVIGDICRNFRDHRAKENYEQRCH